jgi:16S rRNA processing protein RimM
MPPETSPPPTPPASGRGDLPVTLAVIIGAHGVTGEVRLKVFAEDLSAHRRFNGGALTLKSVRPGNNGAIARFAEVADRNAAEALRGTELTVARAELPPLREGEYYHADLLGLIAVAESGEAIGTVVGIENFGAGDVLEIEKSDGKRFMVPMRPEAVPVWDDTTLTIADGWAE